MSHAARPVASLTPQCRRRTAPSRGPLLLCAHGTGMDQLPAGVVPHPYAGSAAQMQRVGSGAAAELPAAVEFRARWASAAQVGSAFAAPWPPRLLLWLMMADTIDFG